MMIEHERRFLLRGLPPGDPVESITIRQAYWRLGGGWSLRIRREGNSDAETRNSVTIKGPRDGVSRPEFTLFLVDDQYAVTAAEGLFRAAGPHKIVKTRHSFLLDGLTWDVDQFHWENDGLFIAELELDDPAALAAQPVPGWAVREITYDSQYGNEALAFHPYQSW